MQFLPGTPQSVIEACAARSAEFARLRREGCDRCGQEIFNEEIGEFVAACQCPAWCYVI